MTTIISEGKTTTEAIENGLKQLKVSKKDVNIIAQNPCVLNDFDRFINA
jgi:predicted RNA-binding protein Jag